LTVDVDSMDPAVASRHTTQSESFCDMTSNQAIVYGEITRLERRNVLEAVLSQVKGVENEADALQHALDLATVLLAKEVFPTLTGRVHAQTSPSTAYDTEQTVLHAKRLVSLFEANDIPRFRVCIKIPATPESIIACHKLEQEGIRTLATCLFSTPQALAASQAGCLYVAPYFNELRVHFQPSLWKEYKDTAREHSTSLVIKEIVSSFKRTASKTLVMPASIVTATEVIALASLHPDHLTLSGSILDQLASLPSPETSPVSDLVQQQEQNDTYVYRTDIDFLADGADGLRKAIESDSATSRKLTDALAIFDEMEQKTKEFFRQSLKERSHVI